jgi:hypothetical protein
MNESDIFELDETARHKSDQTLAPQLSQYLVFSVSGREMAISLAQVTTCAA